MDPPWHLASKVDGMQMHAPLQALHVRPRNGQRAYIKQLHFVSSEPSNYAGTVKDSASLGTQAKLAGLEGIGAAATMLPGAGFVLLKHCSKILPNDKDFPLQTPSRSKILAADSGQ